MLSTLYLDRYLGFPLPSTFPSLSVQRSTFTQIQSLEVDAVWHEPPTSSNGSRAKPELEEALYHFHCGRELLISVPGVLAERLFIHDTEGTASVRPRDSEQTQTRVSTSRNDFSLDMSATSQHNFSEHIYVTR